MCNEINVLLLVLLDPRTDLVVLIGNFVVERSRNDLIVLIGNFVVERNKRGWIDRSLLLVIISHIYGQGRTVQVNTCWVFNIVGNTCCAIR